jgi:hypothetical protein
MAQLLAESAHWGLALVPVLAMLAIFTWLDAFKLMSFREILLLLLMGAIAAVVAYPISGQFIDTLPIGFNNYSRYVAPWIEEALKAILMIGLFRFNRIGYKLDAVISGFAIGAGFSVVENIIYLTIFPGYGAGTWLVRGLGTAVMHGTTVAILAGLAHELAEREMREAASEFDFHLWWSWKRRSRPCLALPPAESPSTIYNSHLAGSDSEQSASFPGRARPSRTPFLITLSRAALAAILALAARITFSMILPASEGCSSR